MLAHSREVAWKVVAPIMDRIESAVDSYDEADLGGMVRHLVPEYTGAQSAHDNPSSDAAAPLDEDLKTGSLT